jgi:HAD superfamily hydrolase (TIGR01509 family)
LVVLDNNGTSLDDLHIAYGSACATLRHFGVTEMPALQQYRDEMNSRYEEWYYRYGMPRRVTCDEMNAVRKAYYAEHGGGAQYRPGVREFLQGCHRHGLHCAMVSAEIASVLARYLEGAGLRECFDDVRPEAWPKTPASVRTLVRLGVPPEQAVYVDDSEEGLAAAKSIGMRTIGFANPTSYASEPRIRAAAPEAIASDFEEVSRTVFLWA